VSKELVWHKLPISGSQRCVGRKAGEAEPVRQGSEAQGAVRDPWSKAGSGEELTATFPARTGNAYDGGGQVCLLGRACALV
jgi:hypothetical protein